MLLFSRRRQYRRLFPLTTVAALGVVRGRKVVAFLRLTAGCVGARGVVIHRLQKWSSSVPRCTSSSYSSSSAGLLPGSLPGALRVLLEALEAEENGVLLQLRRHNPLRLKVDVVVDLPEDSYL